jgi:hypothetical protein
MTLQPFGPWPLSQFVTHVHTRYDRDQPVSRPLHTHRTTQTQNKFIQTSMPRVGFEPIIPVFERAKTVHTLDRAVIVIGVWNVKSTKYERLHSWSSFTGLDFKMDFPGVRTGVDIQCSAEGWYILEKQVKIKYLSFRMEVNTQSWLLWVLSNRISNVSRVPKSVRIL